MQDNHIDTALKELFGGLKFTDEPKGLYDPLRYMMEIGGKHTTTFYEMYALSTCHSEPVEESLGFIVDTPGLRGFGLVDLKKEEIALYFPEMLKASESCRFAPCTHTHEPGCAVKEAVEAGEISYERYSSYLGMLDEEGKYR